MTAASGPQLAALAVLQKALEELYRVEDAQDVTPFVLDEETLSALAQSGAISPRHGAREEVFVLQEGEDLSLAVFLDEPARDAAVDAVQGASLMLDGPGFPDFCVALEGVSHFLLVNHRASLGQTVTELEMELQAEVDKYVLARLCPWTQRLTLTDLGEEPRVTASVITGVEGPPSARIMETLFQSWSLAKHLGQEQVERYVTASRMAHRFCVMLERRFLASWNLEGLMRALRSFYRMTQADRFHLISSLG